MNSSNSSSSVPECLSAGIVFIDDVCSGWQAPSVFEHQKLNPVIVNEAAYGSEGILISQKIIDTNDLQHNKVWDVQYNNAEYNGSAQFLAPKENGVGIGIDMSAYATGKLIFDLKFISYGDAFVGISVPIDCHWPCNYHDGKLADQYPLVNQWKTYEISVADMIRDGLNIKNVTTGFRILPFWNRQANVHFQVDNIRWVKGLTPASTKKCFAQHFDETDNTYTVKVSELSRPDVQFPNWLAAIYATTMINPQWNQVGSAWGYSVRDESVDNQLNQCAYKGLLTASVNMAGNFVFTADMDVGLYFVDANDVVYKFPPVDVATLNPLGWSTLSVPLQADAPYDNIKQVGIYFDLHSSSSNLIGEIHIDNFVITHPL